MIANTTHLSRVVHNLTEKVLYIHTGNYHRVVSNTHTNKYDEKVCPASLHDFALASYKFLFQTATTMHVSAMLLSRIPAPKIMKNDS